MFCHRFNKDINSTECRLKEEMFMHRDQSSTREVVRDLLEEEVPADLGRGQEVDREAEIATDPDINQDRQVVEAGPEAKIVTANDENRELVAESKKHVFPTLLRYKVLPRHLTFEIWKERLSTGTLLDRIEKNPSRGFFLKRGKEGKLRAMFAQFMVAVG